MKSSEKFSELSLEQLIKRKEKLTSLSVGIAIVMLLFCGVLFYLAIKTKNYALIAVGTGSLMMQLPLFVSVNQISTEIKKRDKQA